MYEPIWERHPNLLRAIEKLQERIDYRFRSPQLLYEALTHRSVAGERRKNGGIAPGVGANRAGASKKAAAAKAGIPWNERLEFLGDAVLGLVISTALMIRQELFAEGDLSKIRSSLVNEDSLAGVAAEIDLGPCLLLGKGEEKSVAEMRRSLLADALEALIGAVYEDGGFEQARVVVDRLFASRLTGTLSPLLQRDFKTMLQEFTQEKFQLVPAYRVAKASGPDHAKEFLVEVLVNGEMKGRGSGDSKKRASQSAAKEALNAFQVIVPSVAE